MLCEAVRGNRSLFYDVEQSPLIVVYPSCYDTTSCSLSVRLWIAFYGIVVVMPMAVSPFAFVVYPVTVAV
jgi:hypothetical protein